MRRQDMDPQRSAFGRLTPRAAPSRYERLRLGGRVRSAIIGYGIGAYALFVPHAPGMADFAAASLAGGITSMLFTGTVLQLLVLLVRAISAMYQRATGREMSFRGFLLYQFELLADGATVLLFALATYRGIAQLAAGLD